MTTENPENVVEFESYGGTSETMVNDSPVTIKTLANVGVDKTNPAKAHGVKLTASVTGSDGVEHQLTFETILKSNPAHLASLAQLFSPFNDNIALYGDGTHGNPQRAVSKHNLWGGRGDDDQAARAFVVSADEKQFAIANLGYSSITLGGKKFFEGGFIAHHAYNDAENSYTHAALETVFKDYARTVGDNDLAPGFIYTVAPQNPLYNQMQRVLTEFNHSEVTTSRIQNCFEQVLLADSARFTLVDGQIHENGKPYTVFFDIYDLDSCPELLVPQEETVKDEI